MTASITIFPGPVSNANTSAGVGARRNRREIRNPSNVLHDAADLRITKEQVVEIRNQRRALAARSHIRRTKIRNYGHANARRDHGAPPRSATSL